jgi:8-oxo-dGTP diphosphatase
MGTKNAQQCIPQDHRDDMQRIGGYGHGFSDKFQPAAMLRERKPLGRFAQNNVRNFFRWIMTETLSPDNPQEFKKWVDQLEEKWLAGLIPNPKVASAIITNSHGEVLFLLRDDNPDISFPNYWSLPGGVVEFNELPEQGAKREVQEETGLIVELSFWKVYERKPEKRQIAVDQYIYTGITDKKCGEMTLGEGQALRFLSQDEIGSLPIAYDFDKLINEYFEQLGSSKNYRE